MAARFGRAPAWFLARLAEELAGLPGCRAECVCDGHRVPLRAGDCLGHNLPGEVVVAWGDAHLVSPSGHLDLELNHAEYVRKPCPDALEQITNERCEACKPSAHPTLVRT